MAFTNDGSCDGTTARAEITPVSATKSGSTESLNPVQLEIVNLMIASASARKTYSLSFVVTIGALGIAVGGIVVSVIQRLSKTDQYKAVPESDVNTYQSTI
jgi:general stress protein CsbA